MIEQDSELEAFLEEAAEAAGISVLDLLRRIVHIDPVTNDARFRTVFHSADEHVLRLFRNLDYRIRTLNPGLHYVFRNTYLGYRRESGINQVKASERSQIFASVLPRGDRLCVVLPIDPAPYERISGHRTLLGRGHHGVGDLEVDLPNERAVNDFFRRFARWLMPPNT